MMGWLLSNRYRELEKIRIHTSEKLIFKINGHKKLSAFQVTTDGDCKLFSISFEVFFFFLLSRITEQ